MNQIEFAKRQLQTKRVHAMNNQALVLCVRAKMAFGEVFDALPDGTNEESDARVILKLIRRLEEDLEKVCK